MKVVVYSKDVNLTDRYKNLLVHYNYKLIDDYDELYNEAQKEQIVIVLNIEECGDEISSFILPLVDLHSFIMILDSVPSYEKGKKLIALGIRSYANLMMDDIHMKEAINTVIDGNIWLYPEFINETVLRMQYESNPKTIDASLDILTQREKEVALLVIEKMAYLEISEKLNISLRTVKAHTKNIYEKFNVSNRLAFLLLFNK